MNELTPNVKSISFCSPLLRNQNHGMPNLFIQMRNPDFFLRFKRPIFVSVAIPLHRRLNRKLSDCKIVVNSLRVVSSTSHRANKSLTPTRDNRRSQRRDRIGDNAERCSSVLFKSSAIWFMLRKLVQLVMIFCSIVRIRFTRNLTVEISSRNAFYRFI